MIQQSPDSEIADVTGLTYTPQSPYLIITQYNWTVKAYNTAGESTAPTPFSFTTIEQGYTLIGSGTSSQRQPFGIYYGYERSAALYTKAQIGGYGVLDKVAWNCATISTATVPYKIYAMQTTDTAFTAMTWDSFIASATLVDEGTHIFDTTGWHLFELDVPFPYTSGNLIVAVETYYGEVVQLLILISIILQEQPRAINTGMQITHPLLEREYQCKST